MIQDRWTVYAYFGLDRDEISWHKSPEVAQNVAREYTNQHDRPTSVDLNIVQVSRHGAELIDSDPDLWAFLPRRNPQQ